MADKNTQQDDDQVTAAAPGLDPDVQAQLDDLDNVLDFTVSGISGGNDNDQEHQEDIAAGDVINGSDIVSELIYEGTGMLAESRGSHWQFKQQECQMIGKLSDMYMVEKFGSEKLKPGPALLTLLVASILPRLLIDIKTRRQLERGAQKITEKVNNGDQAESQPA